MNSSNPLFNTRQRDLRSLRNAQSAYASYKGVFLKTFLLLIVLSASFIGSWTFLGQLPYNTVNMILVGSSIVTLILYFVVFFKPLASAYIAIPYVFLEGILLGSASKSVQYSLTGSGYANVVVSAVALTFAAFFIMLLLYRTGIIRGTPLFRSVIISCMVGVLFIYLLQFILSFFGTGIPFIQGSSIVSILFSIFVVGLAAFSFILDFEFIDHMVESGYTKRFEWYAAFGLMLTFIWLYIEILYLLRKLYYRFQG